MKVLSIQSWVSHGHAGNAAAVFPLQRLGVEVIAVHTVLFSNHTGYGSWRGRIIDAELVREIVQGVAERGALAETDALLTGYMGDAAIGEAILDAHARLKAANPAALWCCDPVIGDDGRGVFVRAGVPEFFRDRCVPAADILTPNQFELAWLTGAAARTRADLLAAARSLIARGPRIVFVTSAAVEDTPEDAIDVVAVDASLAVRVRVPKLPIIGRGTGDAIAALFLAHVLAGRDLAAATSLAASSLHGVLRATVAAGRQEMALVASQEQLVAPDPLFPVEPFA